MKRALIHLAICIAIFHFLGMIVGFAYIIGSMLLRHTKRGQYLYAKTKHKYMVWKYTKLIPWFDRNKDNAFFTYFEKANWFKWYGKRVVYVKSKPVEKLSATEKDVKDAINAKDWPRALEIIKGLKETKKTMALKQFIEGKLK